MSDTDEMEKCDKRITRSNKNPSAGDLTDDQSSPKRAKKRKVSSPKNLKVKKIRVLGKNRQRICEPESDNDDDEQTQDFAGNDNSESLQGKDGEDQKGTEEGAQREDENIDDPNDMFDNLDSAAMKAELLRLSKMLRTRDNAQTKKDGTSIISSHQSPIASEKTIEDNRPTTSLVEVPSIKQPQEMSPDDTKEKPKTDADKPAHEKGDEENEGKSIDSDNLVESANIHASDNEDSIIDVDDASTSLLLESSDTVVAGEPDQEKKRSRETSGNVDGVGDTESIGSNTQDTNPKDMVPSKTSTDKETMLSSPVAECGNPIVDASKNALSKIEIDILMLQSKRRDLEDKVSSLKAFNDNSTNDASDFQSGKKHQKRTKGKADISVPSTSKKSTPKVKFVKKPGHEVAKKKTTAMPKRKTTSSNATKKCSSKNTKANTEIPPKQTKEEVEVEKLFLTTRISSLEKKLADSQKELETTQRELNELKKHVTLNQEHLFKDTIKIKHSMQHLDKVNDDIVTFFWTTQRNLGMFTFGSVNIPCDLLDTLKRKTVTKRTYFFPRLLELSTSRKYCMSHVLVGTKKKKRFNQLTCEMAMCYTKKFISPFSDAELKQHYSTFRGLFWSKTSTRICVPVMEFLECDIDVVLEKLPFHDEEEEEEDEEGEDDEGDEDTEEERETIVIPD